MATHFERSAVQTFFESKVGCADPIEFVQFLPRLIALRLSLNDANSLCDSIDQDIRGQFERCSLTIMQALMDIASKNYLWAAVKLYYAVFYALRVELHLNGFSIIRCNQVFTAAARQGSGVDRFNNKDAKGDHGIAISLMIKRLKSYDIMQGAAIDGMDVYNWMKNLRETVQYKMRPPPELVGYEPFFPAGQMDIDDQVSMFLADTDPYFCFDPDYAALAIPIKRLQLTAENVKNHGIALTTEFKRLALTMMDKTPSGKLLKPMFW